MYPEIIGIIASFMVLISFLMPGEIKIRTINMIGAILFIIYGLEIEALSVWLTNSALFIVHAVKLYKFYKRKNEVQEKEIKE